MFCFLLNINSSVGDDGIVTKREGKSLANHLGITYAECSSLLSHGVQQAINTAVELAVNNLRRNSPRKGFFGSKNKTSNSGKESKPLPPVLPPAGILKTNPGRNKFINN